MPVVHELHDGVPDLLLSRRRRSTGDRWEHESSRSPVGFVLLLEHAHIHGINFRPRIEDRYRQWLTHKLASWIDQFGTSGCVGCGRCITWCPVGIDLTQEVAAIRASAIK